MFRILIYLLLISQITWAKDSPTFHLKSFPNEKLVGIFTADSRAHRLSFSRNLDQTSYGVSMGNIFPILNFSKGNIKAQLCAAGSTYLTLLRLNKAGSVLNSDYFADIYVDISFDSPIFLRFGTGHSSQHLSDDAIIAGANYQNYAKDYHQIMAIYQSIDKHFLSYAGLFYNYNFKTSGDISHKQLWQMGIVHYPFKNKKLAPLFYGADIKFREELHFQHTLNLQLGYAIRSDVDHAIRIAANYSQGTDERGYFHPIQRNFAHIGIYFEY